MSVAFTKDEDHEAAAANLPDRPISPHLNLVTAQGLADLEAAYARSKAAYTAAKASGDINENRTAMARATRDLRYYTARRASAQLVEPVTNPDRVVFGCTLTVQREDGRCQTFRIVGEDEADPKTGTLSYVSPLARALQGREIGDTVQVSGASVEVTALS